ncbi:peroxidase family protein [Planctomicrobium piriforme]|uniref:Animal haem peroxidase n=1 Tax=Planctomicrobium piriforme TaxID=1576369 RepID=A0A1I3LMX5_9PLAN|nr:peroxidase family protein [Planctomicrobium piriforme]SFI86053.1 Animal haem peroxidase [Planctomicrobium piriforme]
MWRSKSWLKRRPVTGVAPTLEAAEVRLLLSGSALQTVKAPTPAKPEQTVTAPAPIDGVGNNVAHPTWGSVGVDQLRKAPAAYGDGISTPGGQNRPSPREISNVLADQSDEDILSQQGLSAMAYAWGQFIDHDIDLTPTGTSESLSIAVPKGDPWFDPLGTGTETIDTTRSIYDPATGTKAGNPRQQINAITAFIDGSMIYGSDATTAASLRTFQGGRLATSDGNMLPYNSTDDLSGDPVPMGTDGRLPSDQYFAAGDVRANENVELTALQTLFVREHNYWADKISKENPKLSDEAIYQRARSIVTGEIQAITYNEWLPTLLGQDAVKPYSGYKANVNPGITNEFSTAGFRFGHSMLGDDVEFLDNQGQEVQEGVSLSEAFFNPQLVADTGIDPILKYLTADPSSEIDVKVVDSVRNFLFGPPGAGGLDLVSLNIERGRDHGLADYNTVRQAYGLPKVTSFSQITSNKEVQAELKQLYGNVNNIDLWVGALAEDHVPGASVGATTKAILVDQFTRLRDGDRFWYQNQLKGDALQQVSRTSLSDILKRNTDVTNVQKNAFVFKASISGTVKIDQNRDGQIQQKDPAAAKQTLELVDQESGEVVATTQSDSQGRYEFDVLDGLRTGVYQVRVQAPESGSAMQTQQKKGQGGPAVSRPIAVTRGDQFVKDVNLLIPPKPTQVVTTPSGNDRKGQGPKVGQTTPDSRITSTAKSGDNTADSTDDKKCDRPVAPQGVSGGNQTPTDDEDERGVATDLRQRSANTRRG